MPANDNAPKWLGRSKTIWGGLMMFAPTVIALGGTLGLWDPNILGQPELAQITDLGFKLLAVAGLLVIVWGRKTATSPVTVVPFRAGNKPMKMPTFRKAA